MLINKNWGEENPQTIHEKHFHPQVIVSGALQTGGIMNWYFFENIVSEAITLKQYCYCQIITEF